MTRFTRLSILALGLCLGGSAFATSRAKAFREFTPVSKDAIQGRAVAYASKLLGDAPVYLGNINGAKPRKTFTKNGVLVSTQEGYVGRVMVDRTGKPVGLRDKKTGRDE